MRAQTNALFVTLTAASAFAVASCLGPSDDVFGNANPSGDCPPATYWSGTENKCLPNPADAATDAAGDKGVGPADGGGAGGAAGGAGHADGGGGASGSSGVGGTTGSGGAVADSGKPDGAPPNCLPPDKNGNVMVTAKFHFTANDVPLTLWHNFDGGWNPTPYTSETVVVQAYTTPDLRKLNALLKGGRWLVEGQPKLKFSIPENAVEVWFGCDQSPPVSALTSSGLVPFATVGYGWLKGEPGPNLFFCSAAGGCAYAPN